MRRARLRAGLLVVVAVGLAGVGVQVWRNMAARAPRTAAQLGAEFVPEVEQHIRNFHRVKVRNGRMEWEIQADDARYFAKEDTVVVQGPKVSLYTDEGGLQAWITGDEGRLQLSGQEELRSVVLSGSVVLWLNDIELRTDAASYDRSRDLITAAGAVDIKGRDLDVRAVGMEVDVTPQRLRLLDDVRTVIQSDASRS